MIGAKPRNTSTCLICGERMIIVEAGQTPHPNCDPASALATDLFSVARISRPPSSLLLVGASVKLEAAMHPFLVLIIVAFGGAIVGLRLQALGGDAIGSEHPFLKLLGYVLISLGILLVAIAGLGTALGSDNPEWFI